MRARQGFTAAGVVVALALSVTAAQATSEAPRSAAACSNQTLTLNGKPTALRFGLIGNVTCSEAHSVVRAYLLKEEARQCGDDNNFCNLTFPGGWSCSIFFATESEEAGGAVFGCARSDARIRVFLAKARLRKQEAVVFSPLADGISCHMVDDGSVAGSWVYCWIGASRHPARHVKLTLNGRFSARAQTPLPVGIGGPTTAFGHRVTIGRFRCLSLRSGMKCTVVRTGKGVLFNANGGRRVG
jgi:hypothetical protein